MSLFKELKRRNVFRVAIAYGIAAWLLLQLSDILVPLLNLPESAQRFVLLLLVIGFAPAVIFAWAFEMTPEGLKKEKEVDRSQSITHVTGNKLDRAIIGVLVLTLGYFVYDKFFASDEPASPMSDATQTAEAEALSRERKSIAVLPFANRSSEEQDAFFADGIHDDLLTSLAKVGALKVISRTSVMRYRESGLSIPEIAKELGVTTVLEGGIQRSGSQVRINVQLIDANTDEHLWAENYDRALSAENLFAIQSEISLEIVAALKATLTDEETQRLSEQPTDSLEAYGEFVLGRKEMAERTNEALERAQVHFEKAIELDRDYVMAYVGLSDSLSLQAGYGDLFITDTFEPRQAAIDRALALDPNSGEAYTALANLRQDQNQDEASEDFFKKAIDLNPNYSTAWHWYSILVDDLDRDEEALELINKARELDPNSPIISMSRANTLWELERRDEAFEANRQQLEKTPEFPNLYGQRVGFYFSKGEMGEALRWAKAYVGLEATASGATVSVCNILVQLGDDAEAENCFDRAEEAYPEASFGARIGLHQLRGDYVKSLEVMQQIALRFPFDGPQVGLGYNYILNGQFEEARKIIEKIWPELIGNEPVIIDDQNDNQVQLAGMALLRAGETERANYLFDQLLVYYESRPRAGPGPVFIHAFRGDKEKAIAALRRAMDEGWRGNWFRLRYPMFDYLLEESEWVDLITEIEADIARQRRWYEEHQDDPLF